MDEALQWDSLVQQQHPKVPARSQDSRSKLCPGDTRHEKPMKEFMHRAKLQRQMRTSGILYKQSSSGSVSHLSSRPGGGGGETKFLQSVLILPDCNFRSLQGLLFKDLHTAENGVAWSLSKPRQHRLLSRKEVPQNWRTSRSKNPT